MLNNKNEKKIRYKTTFLTDFPTDISHGKNSLEISHKYCPSEISDKQQKIVC